MQLITPTLTNYRKEHRIKQVGSYDGNRSKVIEQSFRVKQPAVGLPYYFTADPTLDSSRVIITEIAIVSSTAQTDLTSVGTNLQVNLPSTALVDGYFVAVDAKQQIICQIPMHTMCAEVNGGKPCFVWLEDHVWENCYWLVDNIANFDSGKGLVWRITWFDRYL
jgi:hypothetical protein